MSVSPLVLFQEDHARIKTVLDRVLADASAKVAFLVNRNGEQIATAGGLGDIDPTSLASLTAGNVAATHGLARLIGEEEFSILFHEGVKEHLHIIVVPGGAILLVLFDGRTTLGLVRLRVRKAAAELGPILQEVRARCEARRDGALSIPGLFAGMTDDDIDALLRP